MAALAPELTMGLAEAFVVTHCPSMSPPCLINHSLLQINTCCKKNSPLTYSQLFIISVYFLGTQPKIVGTTSCLKVSSKMRMWGQILPVADTWTLGSPWHAVTVQLLRLTGGEEAG